MSLVSIWNQNFEVVATQHECPPPQRHGRRFAIVVHGDCPLHEFARDDLTSSLLDRPLFITADLADAEYHGGSRRLTGRVMHLSVEERQCECGQTKLTTTTIEGERW